MKKLFYLLDTNVISELAKPDPNQTLISLVDERKSLCAICATTWNELLYGIYNLPKCKKRSFLFDFLVDYVQSEFPIMPFDNHAAWIQADIRSRLKSIGREENEGCGYADTEIASIAIANQMVLVTRNVRHFEPIAKIDSVFYCENWFE